nr:hypothetical protein [Tanacetum cinerariifolium]
MPSDHIVNLGPVVPDQVFSATSLPPPTNVRKRAPGETLAEESTSKKEKNVKESSSGESMVGSSHEATDDLSSSKAGFKHLVSKGSSKTSALLSSASTHSEPLVSARPGPRFAHVSHHIPGIVFDPVQDFADTP